MCSWSDQIGTIWSFSLKKALLNSMLHSTPRNESGNDILGLKLKIATSQKILLRSFLFLLALNTIDIRTLVPLFVHLMLGGSSKSPVA